MKKILFFLTLTVICYTNAYAIVAGNGSSAEINKQLINAVDSKSSVGGVIGNAQSGINATIGGINNALNSATDQGMSMLNDLTGGGVSAIQNALSSLGDSMSGLTNAFGGLQDSVAGFLDMGGLASGLTGALGGLTGQGVSVVGCCNSTGPLASSTALSQSTAAQVSAVDKWAEMSQDTMTKSTQAQTVTQDMAVEAQGQMAAESTKFGLIGKGLDEAAKRETWGLNDADLSCITPMSYYINKTEENTGRYAAKQNAKIMELNKGVTENMRAQAFERAKLAELTLKDCYFFADSTYTPAQQKACEAAIDLVFTSAMPPKTPDDLSGEQGARYMAAKAEHAFATSVFAMPFQRFLASRVPQAPSKNPLSWASFYNIDPPTTTTINTKDGKLEIEAPKAIGANDYISESGISNMFSRMFLSQPNIDEVKDPAPILRKILLTESMTANEMRKIYEELKIGNMALALMAQHFLGDIQSEKIRAAAE